MEKTEQKPKRFYDEGWDACCAGEEFDHKATRSWRDGWLDCFSVDIADRRPFAELARASAPHH